jgi:integrase
MNTHCLTLERVEQYLDHCRTLGYEMRGRQTMLRRFVAFASQRAPGSPLTTDLALAWATESKDHAPSYQARKLSTVRTFARYCAIFDARMEIPSLNLLGNTHRRPAPYIYSPEEVQSLLEAARALRPADALRPQTYAVLLGLLASTGIRIGEAIRLDADDVRWADSAMVIRNSKRLTERLVPLHASTLEALTAYAQRRRVYLHDPSFTRFFISDNGGAISHREILRVFGRLRVRAGIGGKGRRQPRIHDLRHTFACMRLLQWQKEGVALDQAILSLSAYLGHREPTDTYWYMTGIPELLDACGERFEQYAKGRAAGGRP